MNEPFMTMKQETVRNGYERRRSRDSFTKSLVAICERLDGARTASLQWQDRYLRERAVGTIEAVSLWVVGSYARGASKCGDLDLVLEYEKTSGYAPPRRRACAALVGRRPDVRVYVGTPEENESGVSFNEAIAIWSRNGTNWREAIASIKENPEAGRFSRPTDRIPLRTEQLDADVDQLKAIVEMEEKGLIAWDYTPLSELAAVSPEGEEELNLERLLNIDAGTKTRALLPYLLAYFRQFGGWPKPLLRTTFENTQFGIGGARVILGQPHIPIHILDDVTTSELVLMPHVTARGPNGIWRLRRGSEHPLEKQGTCLRPLYYLVDEDAEPAITNIVARESWRYSPAHACTKALDMFSSKKKANDWARTLAADEIGNYQVKQVGGKDLLQVLAHLDLVLLPDTELALTQSGCWAVEVDRPSTTEELMARLTRR